MRSNQKCARLSLCSYNQTKVVEHRSGFCIDAKQEQLLTSEAEEGEEVLRLGLAAGQVLDGGGQRGQGER